MWEWASLVEGAWLNVGHCAGEHYGFSWAQHPSSAHWLIVFRFNGRVMTSTAAMKNLEPRRKFEWKPAEVTGLAVLPPFSEFFLFESVIQGFAVMLIYMYSAPGANEMRAVHAGLNTVKKNDTVEHFISPLVVHFKFPCDVKPLPCQYPWQGVGPAHQDEFVFVTFQTVRRSSKAFKSNRKCNVEVVNRGQVLPFSADGSAAAVSHVRLNVSISPPRGKPLQEPL